MSLPQDLIIFICRSFLQDYDVIKVLAIYETTQDETIQFVNETDALVFLLQSCYYGDLIVLKWVLKYFNNSVDDKLTVSNVYKIAIKNGFRNAAAASFLGIEKEEVIIFTEMKLKLFVYDEDIEIHNFIEFAIVLACLFGKNEEMISFLFQNFESAARKLYCTERVFKYACINGYLDLARRQVVHNYVPDYKLIFTVCANGHLDVVEWLLTNVVTIPQYALQKACKHGHLEVAKFLYGRMLHSDTIIIHELSFVGACKNGHVDIMNWLLEIYPTLCLSYNNHTPLRIACKMGHLNVVKWLYKYYNPEEISAADAVAIDCFVDACSNGHLIVAIWILGQQQYKKEYFVSQRNESAFRYACYNNHLNIAKWLLTINPTLNVRACNDFAFLSGCKNGNYDTVTWLYSTYYYNTVPNLNFNFALLYACENGHARIVKWLRTIAPKDVCLSLPDHAYLKWACTTAVHTRHRHIKYLPSSWLLLPSPHNNVIRIKFPRNSKKLT